MKRLFALFLQGLLFTAPLGITVYIIYLVFQFIDGIFMPSLIRLIGFRIPGLGLAGILVFITLIGFIGQSIIATPIRNLVNATMKRLPVLQLIYSSIKDFLSAFVGKEKRFSKPVLVNINKMANLEKVGFITEDDLSDFGVTDKVAVYFPHAYSLSGELFFVPKDQVKPIDVNPAVAMKFMVSGGIARV
jgi:uncharacterized membrane protein